jgi:hypothetical protein
MIETLPTLLLPLPLTARDSALPNRELLREVEIKLIRSEFRQLAP